MRLLLGTLSLLWIAGCGEDDTFGRLAPDTSIDEAPPAVTNQRHARIVFHAAGRANRFTCQLDSTPAVDCASPFEADVADGAHTLAVVAAFDKTVDVTPATAAWRVDTAPPDTSITEAPPALDNSLAPAFRFEGSDDQGAVTFECSLDDAAFAPCASPATVAVGDGGHGYRVRAVDAAGNVDPTPAAATWSVDSSAPDTAITAGPAAGAATGASVTFEFGSPDSPVTFECSLDGAAFAACTSPRMLTLAGGQHTFAVRARDALGMVDPSPPTRTWTVDLTPPTVVFDAAPPAQWPVNYFDMAFHTTDATATLTCSLDGAAFTACTSPLTITTVYNAGSTFAVQAKDAVGNVSTISTSWTSSDGLVLHYPWEQGKTHNTSLLAQVAGYSPDSSAAVTITGGWAGTAAASPAKHTYPKTFRPLSSSATGGYTASVWVRTSTDPQGGTILSTLAADNGFALTVSGRTATLTVNEGGKPFTASATIPPNQWVQLAVLTTGTAKGLQLLVNGVVAGTATPPKSTGFGAGQAGDLIVGDVGGIDLDDLRFYNRALSGNELCTALVRGQLDSKGACAPLIPGFELDFENKQARDTGNWQLSFSPPDQPAFPPTKLGAGLTVTGDKGFGYTAGFASRVSQAPGHSFSLWFVAGDKSDTLIDFLHLCSPAGGPTCGIRVTYDPGALTVTANGGATNPFSKTFGVEAGAHSLVVTEQKGEGTSTQSLTIYIDGVASVMAIGGVNVYASPSDSVAMPHTPGTTVDEYEFWPRDLSAAPDLLCENGWDGEWNPATATCMLTAN